MTVKKAPVSVAACEKAELPITIVDGNTMANRGSGHSSQPLSRLGRLKLCPFL